MVSGVRVAILLLLVAALYAPVLAASSEGQEFYPCSQCHAALTVSGQSRASEFHGVDLTEGAHGGLYCSNCHLAPQVDVLVGGVNISIPGLHPRDSLMELNKACATCHADVYRDYQLHAHGNQTYTCSGGTAELVEGYKGVGYWFHLCPEYRDLSVEPARACVECHNPHDPTMPALSILPEPSDRPSPPDESSIALGGLVVVLVGLGIILWVAPLGKGGGEA